MCGIEISLFLLLFVQQVAKDRLVCGETLDLTVKPWRALRKKTCLDMYGGHGSSCFFKGPEKANPIGWSRICVLRF